MDAFNGGVPHYGDAVDNPASPTGSGSVAGAPRMAYIKITYEYTGTTSGSFQLADSLNWGMGAYTVNATTAVTTYTFDLRNQTVGPYYVNLVAGTSGTLKVYDVKHW